MWFKVDDKILEDLKMKRLKNDDWGRWLKLMALGSKSPIRGLLLVSETIPVNVEDIAKAFGDSVDDTFVTLKIFKALKLLAFLTRGSKILGTIKIVNWEKYQGSSAPDKVRERIIKYRQKEGNRLKDRARSAVYNEIQKGTLMPQPCEICGQLDTQAHHYKGYEKENWFEIKWLCKKHHNETKMKRDRNDNETNLKRDETMEEKEIEKEYNIISAGAANSTNSSDAYKQISDRIYYELEKTFRSIKKEKWPRMSLIMKLVKQTNPDFVVQQLGRLREMPKLPDDPTSYLISMCVIKQE
jgi:hypothetical protein